jgi:hypothetical protein
MSQQLEFTIHYPSFENINIERPTPELPQQVEVVDMGPVLDRIQVRVEQRREASKENDRNAWNRR